MNFTKNIFFIITSSILIIAVLFFVTYKKSIPDTTTLTIGTAAGYAPYVSINAQGEYEGFDIDVAKEVAHLLGKTLVLKDLGSMTSLMMALNQGSINAIIWGISITEPRKEKFAMIHYQGAPVTSYPLIFWQQIPQTATDLNSMHGLTICAEPSSSQYDVLKKYPGIIILPTEKVDDALMHIQYGTAIAALVDPAIAAKFKAKFPEIQILNVELPEQEQSQGVGIVIAQQNKTLQEQMQHAVDILKQNNTITKLEAKWGIS